MAATGFSQGMGDVRARARQGLAGDWLRVSDRNEYDTGLNQSPQSVQVSTSTVTDPGDDVDITITLNGVDVTYNTGTGDDADGIGAGLAVAINAEPLVAGQVRATFSTATDVLTLTGLNPGLAFTVAEASGALSTPSTVAAGTADDIPFGRAVISQGFVSLEGEGLVALPVAANFTAQVQTHTVVTGDATARTVRVWELRSRDERVLLGEGTFTGNATQATEATAIEGAINTAVAADTVIATTSTADVIITAEVPGLEFEVEIEAASGDITKANTTGPSQATSLARAMAGVAMYSPNDEALVIGGDEGIYKGNAGVRYAHKGELWITSSETVSAGDPIYVETAAGDDTGRLYTTDSATRLALGRGVAQWLRSADVTTDNLAALRLSVR